MKQATLEIHPKFTIGSIDRRIFSGFLEHLGRAIYSGVYDPSSTISDEDGFRTDVLEALENLKVSCVRYPGGNFVSGYHWQNGVGPKESRPSVIDLAWKSLETNAFGTDEFMQLCKRMDWSPMLTVNLGTGTPEEAKDWVEYCNGMAGPNAEMRKRNGNPEPYNIPLWFLGNEMDAPWQLGHLPADQYAIKAEQAARMMKVIDPSIELVIAGSCLPSMPTYLQWDQTILEYAGEVVDYIGFHNYVTNPGKGTGEYLAFSKALDQQIEDMQSVCRFVQGKFHRKRPIQLCLDEWNVWYRNQEKDGKWLTGQPLLEERYDFEDALIVAGFLISFLRHADVLKITNIAQLVNVLAPVMTSGDTMFKQTIYWPFEMISKLAYGNSVQDLYSGPSYNSSYGNVDLIDRAVINNGNTISTILINKDETESVQVRLTLHGVEIKNILGGTILSSTDPKQKNSFETPDAVVPKVFSDYNGITNNEIEILCPPLSLVTFSLQI